MKIAYVVPYVPNLIRTRPYNLITQLASMGHEVVAFTLGSNRQDLIDARLLKERCSEVLYYVQPHWRSLWNSTVAVPSNQPLQSVFSWHVGMARELAERVSREEFDIVHVEHLRGSRYGTFIKSRFPAALVVWDSVDCISHLFRQAAGQSRSFFGKFVTRFELPRTIAAEGKLICSFEHILVTSLTDKNALMETLPDGKDASPISILPNGVDLDYFHPNPEIQREEATIIFSGKMSYHANISMAKYLVSEIMPRVWQDRPDACLLIVGKDPPSDIRELGKNSLITVTGTVNDIRPFLWRATVSVVPLLYGAGIQNKILEAMATGTPVVTTSQTLLALQTRPGKDVLVADTVDELARMILQIIADQELGRAISDSGEKYVRLHHNWKMITANLSDIYSQIVRQHTN